MARYRLLIKPSAAKELEALPKKDRRAVVDAIDALADTPRPPGCEKLTARSHYRIRHGRHRVLYEVHDGAITVLVVKIGHRRDIYR